MRAPYVLTPTTYPDIRCRMLGEAKHRGEKGTFTDEMAAVETEAPELFLVTAYSAIPLADTIRGYYAKRELPPPRVGYIRADHRISRRGTAQVYRIASEVARLTNQLQGVSRACIVDQYSVSRRTVKFAVHILEELNVPTISSLEGKWYMEAYKQDVSQWEPTSIHANFMYQIGAQAASDALEIGLIAPII